MNIEQTKEMNKDIYRRITSNSFHSVRNTMASSHGGCQNNLRNLKNKSVYTSRPSS